MRVERLGSQKPARVFVAFVDDSFEGKEEWVPPARLKVLWSEAGKFQAREERWARVAAVGPGQEDPRSYAASEIIDEHLAEELGSINYRSGGSISIAQPEVLASQLHLTVEQLTKYPESFTEDGYVVAPWPATEYVARALAAQHAEQILPRVQKEERQAKYEAIHGRDFSIGRGETRHISPQRSLESDQEFSAPIREVLRSWCGADSVGQFDELIALRQEIHRVGVVAQKAIDALKAHDHRTVASQLQRELGTPVEMLRADAPES
ncbi:hypothetical protein GCM10023160_18830 [Brachybacterium paraconglomeratum]|uniref:hypothetical protein n=1 Tax=Brachybacterium paraconglomeratum TaxID=173362 RepID=UPI0031ED5B7F